LIRESGTLELEARCSSLWGTDKLFGERRGELRPEPRLLISPRFRDVLLAMNARGLELEAAHFV